MEGTITALEPTRRGQRLRLYLDGQFAAEISTSAAADHRLHKGMYLSAETAVALLTSEGHNAAMQAALRLLAQRDRSVAEVRQRLTARGHDASAVEAVIARLSEMAYLDDVAFAQRWVEGRQRTAPRGRRRLRAELAEKGIEPESAEHAVEVAAGDEHTQARRAALSRTPRLADADFPTFARRLGGFLTRRGFSGDVVYDVIRSLWAEQGCPSEETDEVP